jgi:hypothetical protein
VTGRRLALVCGCNDYPGTGMDLRGCVNDAKDWAMLLRASLLPTAEVSMLLDEQATRAAILEWLRFGVESLEAGDFLYFTFSGHGTYVGDESGDEHDRADECLCPYDVMTAGPIVDDELNAIFAQRKGGRVVVIADSCYSGTVAKAASTVWIGPCTNESRMEYSAPRFLPPQLIPTGALAKRGARARIGRGCAEANDEAWITLSACQDWEVSYDARINGRHCGAFTNAAIGAFPGATSYLDWMRKIRATLPSERYPQTPKLTGGRFAKWRKPLG